MSGRKDSNCGEAVRKTSWVEPVPYIKKRRMSSIKPLQARKSKDVSLLATKTEIGDDVIKMEDNPTDYAIQLDGCRKMGTYASYGSLDVMVSRPHGIELVIDAMRSFPDMFELQTAAIDSLSQLATGHSAEASCMYIFKNSGFDAIVAALKKFPNEVQLKYKAFKSIYALSSFEDVMNSIGTEKVVEITMNQIRQGVNSPAILQTGFLILASACSDEKTAWYLIESEILNNVFDEVAKHATIVELVEAGCRLIGSLSFHESICPVVSGHNCMKLILKALDIAMDNSELAASVSFAVACLTKCVSNKENFVVKEGFLKLLLIMARFPKISSIQEYGCWTISNLSETENNNIREKISNVNTANALIEAMDRYPDNEEINEQSVFALAQFLESQDIQIHLYQKDGIRLVIHGMRLFPDNPEIQEQGCRVLGNLAVTELVRTAVSQDGGIGTIVMAMERHPDNEQLIEYGCHALANLAAEVPENKAAIAEEGGVAIILNSMRKHDQNRLIQISGCRALCNLSGNELISLKILAEGGIPTLLSTWNSFLNDEIIENLVYNELNFLTETVENTQDVIKDSRTLPSILQVLNRNEIDVRLKSICCKLLQVYAFEEQNHKLLGSLNAVGEVVSLMKTTQHEPEIQEFGCKFLALMSYGDGKDCVIKANGIDMIFATMEKYQDNLQLQLVCCGALSCLASEDVNRNRIKSNAWSKALLRNMSKYADNEEIQIVGCLAIQGLSAVGRQNCANGVESSVNAVVSAMQCFPNSQDLLICGCNTLGILATSDVIRERMKANNVQDVVVKAMKTYPDLSELQEIGCFALERLSRRDACNLYEPSKEAVSVLEDILVRFQDYEMVHKEANRLLSNFRETTV